MRLILTICLVLLPPAITRAADGPVDFVRDVRPILSDNCFKCHGPDENARKADLRLDTEKSARAALGNGKPETSKLVQRILSGDPDEQMPPPASKLSLTPGEIAILQRWVREGGRFAAHWSFQSVGDVKPPMVRQAGWVRNPIDRFVLASLEQQQLKPNREASRQRLIRRVSFDLTGLPPTLKEIDAFLADKSEQAFERVVDRLLAKPGYGERMAADWLDIARYSDSYGYQVDRERYVWPWRDWVVRSFNANMPYDRFLSWQLAGDLLPNPTDEMRLATTFNRLHSQKVEGGSTLEEFRVEYVADRNHTFAMAFLGLTLECARCHEHKFDPITHKEYYQLFAFFNNIDESGVYSYFTPAIPTPTMLLTSDGQKAAIARVESKIAESEAAWRKVGGEREAAFREWLKKRPFPAVVPNPLPGRVLHMDFEKFNSGANRSIAGRFGKGVRLTGDDGIGTKVGNFRRSQPFSVSLWINTPDEKQRAILFHRSRAWTDAGSRGYQLMIEDGRLSGSLIHFWPGNALRVLTRRKVPVAGWHHVVMSWDGSNRAAGLKIYLDGRPAACTVVRDNLYKNITGGGGDTITIGQRMRDRGFTNGGVDEFQVFDRRLVDLEVAQLFDGHSLGEALATPVKQLAATQVAGLREYYLETFDKPYIAARQAARTQRDQRGKLVDGLKEIMVMTDLDSVRKRQTYVLRRGAYDAPTDPVEPDTPAVFLPFPKDAPRNRAGLARWLTSPVHPLTSRVAVNRLWQQCFGGGLVRTPEDFGSQGQPPTHPKLFDWLARDFVTHGWDIKRALRQVVLSATYRQDSTADRELVRRDPDNLLLARGPGYQLPAEMIRDNALWASGLLVDKQSGPPARPYDLAVSFKPIKIDQGEGLYRRSLYTFWKRTGPAPVMMTLDASKRDVCVVKRERTSSPLQACVLLNGPQFVEAARVFGQVLLKKHGDNLDALVTEMFRRLTSRRPSDREREILGRAFAEQLAYFTADPKRAEAFLKTGKAPVDKTLPAVRIAAAGMLANTLMNFDECLMKR
ncbi:MAG: hypothetical protein CMJ65_16070 [Planctomycetaceae bacterium]|nr:hypothetical protein [Planctomycetaceae bacterium]